MGRVDRALFSVSPSAPILHIWHIIKPNPTHFLASIILLQVVAGPTAVDAEHSENYTATNSTKFISNFYFIQDSITKLEVTKYSHVLCAPNKNPRMKILDAL